MLVFELETRGKDWKEVYRTVRKFECTYSVANNDGIYALYSEDRIVYIGETTGMAHRLENHHILKDDVYGKNIVRIRMFLFENTDLACMLNRKIIECYMISTAKPIYNDKDKDVICEDQEIMGIASDILSCMMKKYEFDSDHVAYRVNSDRFRSHYMYVGDKRRVKASPQKKKTSPKKPYTDEDVKRLEERLRKACAIQREQYKKSMRG